jgi:hypothetical protein
MAGLLPVRGGLAITLIAKDLDAYNSWKMPARFFLPP